MTGSVELPSRLNPAGLRVASATRRKMGRRRSRVGRADGGKAIGGSAAPRVKGCLSASGMPSRKPETLVTGPTGDNEPRGNGPRSETTAGQLTG